MKKLNKISHLPFFYNFLAASRNANGLAVLALIDPVDERILYELAMHWRVDSPISVVQTMHAVNFVSTTTAHRRLKSLRKNKMIDFVLDVQDNRVKFIVPTEKTLQYFEHLGQCIKAAQTQA